MTKRILIFGAILFVFAGAVLINLAILDILSLQELRQSLRKFLSVMLVSTIAILIMHKLFGLATQRTSDAGESKASVPPAKGEKGAPN